jgi:hypothetical protein
VPLAGPPPRRRAGHPHPARPPATGSLAILVGTPNELVHPLVGQVEQDSELASGESTGLLQHLLGQLARPLLGHLRGATGRPYPGHQPVQPRVACAELVVQPTRSEYLPYLSVQRVQGACPTEGSMSSARQPRSSRTTVTRLVGFSATRQAPTGVSGSSFWSPGGTIGVVS